MCGASRSRQRYLARGEKGRANKGDPRNCSSGTLAQESIGFRLMNKVVYLVGTLHKYEGCAPHTWRATKNQLEQFRNFLAQSVQLHDIRSIAEEMNTQELEKYGHPDLPSGESIPFQVARKLNLRHKYCDPDKQTRQQLGIVNNYNYNNDDKREVYLLQQLKELDAFPCLLVLGATEIYTFCDRLKESGFEPILLDKDWTPVSSSG